MLKAVIFDMDGVIVDSQPLHFEVERQIFKNLGLNITQKEHDSYVGCTEYNMWESIIKKYNLNQTTKDLIERKQKIYIDNLMSEKLSKPMDGLLKLMSSLSENGIKMALASSSTRQCVDIITEKFGLNKYLQTTFSGNDVEKR